MHEISLCEDVVRLIGDQARQHRFTRVRTVRLQIGRLSCVAPEALRFAFDAVAKNTICDGARLEIEEIGGRGWCDVCRRELAVGQRFDACPECGHYPLTITAGEEMRIGELEVE
ncbi:MAG TPA: hydrogenase maturation nickel metallochaperone HypA [Mariprofundaceae bacterium]|nr:hydrogenase maturation nickel metallochaperone HypA [Mariprofundaceae bacterium]